MSLVPVANNNAPDRNILKMYENRIKVAWGNPRTVHSSLLNPEEGNRSFKTSDYLCNT